MFNCSKNKAPCYQCEDRNVSVEFNCHNDCEKYNTWKKELHDKKNELRFRAQKIVLF